jgi:hypothetical protein
VFGPVTSGCHFASLLFLDFRLLGSPRLAAACTFNLARLNRTLGELGSVGAIPFCDLY